jgi:hypothetical protein
MKNSALMIMKVSRKSNEKIIKSNLQNIERKEQQVL